MGHILDRAEALWNETIRVGADSAMAPFMDLETVAPHVAFVSSFANVTAVNTDDGLVLIDTGSFALEQNVYNLVRDWTSGALHTAIYTHGHVDHCFGVERYESENPARRAHVISHAATPARFERYARTQGYNSCINMRQFRIPMRFPDQFRMPDQTLTNPLKWTIGNTRFEAYPARGETDDHLYVHLPDQRVLCTGDLFLWVFPNAGNPQKVQRYCLDWVHALRAMSSLEASILLPGHGFPIVGHDRVKQALESTADALLFLHDETLARMNAGMTLEEILHEVKVPARLQSLPYLQPVYDEPEFVIRNIWRLYGGWYDGNPAHLKPAPESALARELARMSGGARALATRAQELVECGEYALACHFAEFAARAAPHDRTCIEARAKVYRERAAHERSLMSKGIYNEAAESLPRGVR